MTLPAANLENGFSLTTNDTKTSFAIILHNVRTYHSGGVIAVVRSKNKAEETLKQFQDAQSSPDYNEGWRYFMEPSTLTPGTDPAEATHLRQAELESREKASAGPPRNSES